MFTGLVSDLGRITGAQRSADGVRLTVDSELASELAAGRLGRRQRRLPDRDGGRRRLVRQPT